MCVGSSWWSRRSQRSPPHATGAAGPRPGSEVFSDAPEPTDTSTMPPPESSTPTASPTPPALPAEPPATKGPPSPTCVKGWVTPPAGTPQFTDPLGMIRRIDPTLGKLAVVDMRYFVGPESPPSEQGYLQDIERWYIKLYDEQDPRATRDGSSWSRCGSVAAWWRWRPTTRRGSARRIGAASSGTRVITARQRLRRPPRHLARDPVRLRDGRRRAHDPGLACRGRGVLRRHLIRPRFRDFRRIAVPNGP